MQGGLRELERFLRSNKHNIASMLADNFASAISSCGSDYCVARELLYLVEDVEFYSRLASLDPAELLRSILFDPRVGEAAASREYPTRQLLWEIRRPRFSRLARFEGLIERWLSYVEKLRPGGGEGGAVCRTPSCRDAIVYGLVEAAAEELAESPPLEVLLTRLANMAKLVYMLCDGDRACFRDYFARIVSSDKLAGKLEAIACEPGKARALIRLDPRFSILAGFEEELVRAASRAGCRSRSRKPSTGPRATVHVALLLAAALLSAILLAAILLGHS